MTEFLLVLGIAVVAAFLTILGAVGAERFSVPNRVISGALQFAAGIITALVGFSLMPTAVLEGPLLAVILAFCAGGAAFVAFEYVSERRMAPADATGVSAAALGLYFGVLMDVTIDGIVIGMASTLTPATGLLLALSVAISTAPLAFVMIATAKRQGISRDKRRLFSLALFGCLVAGALLGYLLLRNQPVEVRLVLLAMASGFLLTTVTQSMIPEASRDSNAGLGFLYVLGITLFALLTLGLTG